MSYTPDASQSELLAPPSPALNNMIYGSLDRNEQQGWMSRGGPECIFSQTDPYLQHILQSFASVTTNPLSQEHIKWLYHWCGAYECIRTFNAHQLASKNSLFGARVAFLQRSWKEQHFRPFDTMEMAIQYLQAHEDFKYTVRLSTTRPGFITITTRSLGKFSHTRYQVLSNSSIVDMKGNQHLSVSSLAATIA